MNWSTSPATAHQIYVSFLPLKRTRLRDNEAAKLRSKQKTYKNLMSLRKRSGPIHFSYKTLNLEDVSGAKQHPLTVLTKMVICCIQVLF